MVNNMSNIFGDQSSVNLVRYPKLLANVGSGSPASLISERQGREGSSNSFCSLLCARVKNPTYSCKNPAIALST